MRALAFALVWMPLVAAAEPMAPVAVEPFHARCFDADKLAERLRDELPASTVRVGPPGSARHAVRVREEGDKLVVDIAQRGADGKTAGTQQRVVPAGAACDAALQATALIVARAVMPLHGPSVPAPPAKRPKPVIAPQPPKPDPSGGGSPPAGNENENANANGNANANANENENENVNANPVVVAKAVPKPAVAVAPVAPSVVRTPAVPPRRRQIEIDLRAAWTFPLDGPPSAPAGELAVGYTFFRGVGLSVRAGVEGENTLSQTTSAGSVSIATRRVPLGVEVHYDLRIPTGVIRFAAGPMVALWLARSGGVPRPTSRVLAEPGMGLRVGYRLDLRYVAIAAGVALDALFTADNLQIGGAGTVARTSLVELTPYLSFGGQIF